MMGDPNGMAGSILNAARRVFENDALQASDVISSFTTDTRKLIQIISDVKAETGVELPINAFASPSSIAEIGELVSAGRTPLPLSMQLKGGRGSPIFLFPGVSGTILELKPMAAAFTTDSPVYALTYPGLDGESPPLESTLGLAKLLHTEIRSIAPKGQVHLLGYSAGGCIAVEVARMLGPDDTGFLGLIEAPIHLRHWPLSVWLKFIFRGPRKALSAKEKSQMPIVPPVGVKASPKPQAASKAALPARNKLAIALDKLQCVVYQRYGSISAPSFLKSFLFRVDNLPDRIQNVRDASIRATAYASPARFEGPATYYKTEGGDGLMCEPSIVWTPILPNVRFQAVAGRHGSILYPPYISALAQHVSKQIAAVESVDLREPQACA